MAWATMAVGVSPAKDEESEPGSRQETGGDSHQGSGSGSRGENESNVRTDSDQSSDPNGGSNQNSGSSQSGMSKKQGGEAVSSRPVGSKTESDKSSTAESDQDRAFEAAGKGEIISLKDALREVASRYDGKVIEINLRSSTTSEIYQMKLRTPDGTIKILKMDARTGKFAGLFGF